MTLIIIPTTAALLDGIASTAFSIDVQNQTESGFLVGWFEKKFSFENNKFPFERNIPIGSMSCEME